MVEHWTDSELESAVDAYLDMLTDELNGRRVVKAHGNPPTFSGRQKWNYAASASFCIGVMPPSAMFGRSWL